MVGRSCEMCEVRRVWDRRGSAEQILEDLEGSTSV